MEVDRYIANSDRKCVRCGGEIKRGDKIAKFRERATSSHEAAHAGSMYVSRSVCLKCAPVAQEAK